MTIPPNWMDYEYEHKSSCNCRIDFMESEGKMISAIDPACPKHGKAAIAIGGIVTEYHMKDGIRIIDKMEMQEVSFVSPESPPMIMHTRWTLWKDRWLRRPLWMDRLICAIIGHSDKREYWSNRGSSYGPRDQFSSCSRCAGDTRSER